MTAGALQVLVIWTGMGIPLALAVGTAIARGDGA